MMGGTVGVAGNAAGIVGSAVEVAGSAVGVAAGTVGVVGSTVGVTENAATNRAMAPAAAGSFRMAPCEATTSVRWPL